MLFGIAMVCAAVVLPLLLWLAPRVGWLDRPDPRKPHARPVPPIGGVVWYLGFASALGLTGAWSTPLVVPVLGAVLAMLIVGLIDDLRPQSSMLRLGLQALVAALLAVSGILLVEHLGRLLPGSGAITLGPVAVLFSTFAVVGVINALNMCDGMDGLAGSQIAIALLALIVFQGGAVGLEWTLATAALGALIPFLLLNLRLPWQSRARVFFGDAGSMAAGLLLSVLLVRSSQGSQPVLAPVAALWLLAVPLIDTVSVMLRRITAGTSPFKPDQQHVHHLLLRSGFSVPGVWAILTVVALATAGFAWLSHRLAIPEWVQFAAFLSLALGYHFWVCASLRRGRVLGRDLSPQLSRL